MQFECKIGKDMIMGKINIITNISSKTHAGSPFCRLDNKKCKIENDKIVFMIEGEHNLKIGYRYTSDEDGRLINYDEKIIPIFIQALRT